ncbi:MAG: hypothetical protein EOP49_13295, partial [Sphingobacteriales bacterium]
MKKFLRLTLLAAGLAFGMTSCNNGDYDTDPDIDNSQEINPLNPKGGMNTSFDWSGTEPMSMEVNGEAWKADGAFIMTQNLNNTDYYVISGTRNSGNGQSLTLLLKKPLNVGQVVNISAGKSVVMQKGSKIDVSGGSTKFEAGTVKTTLLLSKGKLVDISEATPDVVYDGIYNGTFTETNAKFGISKTYQSALAPDGGRFDPGSVEG